MTEEAFLQALRDNPSDDATRLVLADWLEEQGDEAARTKAEYLRLDCKMSASLRLAKHRGRLRQRRELAAKLPSSWLAVVSKARIELCEFRIQCPLKWESLQPVAGSTTRRYCDQCQQAVTYFDTIEDARRHAARGGCVAIDARVARTKGDLYPLYEGSMMTMGMLMEPSGQDAQELARRLREEIEGLRED